MTEPQRKKYISLLNFASRYYKVSEAELTAPALPGLGSERGIEGRRFLRYMMRHYANIDRIETYRLFGYNQNNGNIVLGDIKNFANRIEQHDPAAIDPIEKFILYERKTEQLLRQA